MKSIDPLTLIFTAGVLALMSSGFLFIMRRSLPGTVHGVRSWAYAMLIGWFSSMLRWSLGGLPAHFGSLLADALIMVSLALMLYGLRRFNEQAPNMMPIAWLGGIAFLLMLWLSVFADLFYLRVVLFCIYALSVLLLSAHASFAGRRMFKSPGQYLIGGFFLAIALIVLLRLFDALALGEGLDGWGANSLTNLLFIGSFNFMIVGLFFGFVMLINDRLRAELANLANTDPLTVTLNRRAFMNEAGRVLARERRQQRPTALLMLDLDHFKAINDRYGHVQGDHVLERFVERVRERLRAGDVFGRYGGEEFVILLPGAGKSDARVLAEQLRGRIAQSPLGAGSEQVALTVSIGVAIDTGEGSVPELIEAADWALYRAKEHGRNRVVVFENA